MSQSTIKELMEQGLVAAQSKDFSEALSWFSKALNLSPEYAELHYHLGNTFAALMQYEKAVAHLKQAIFLDVRHARAHNNLGRLFHKQKHFTWANRHYEWAIQYQPHYIDASINRGLLLVEAEKIDLAIQQFESILTWNSNVPIVYEQLAQIALHQKDIQKAKHYYLERLNFPIQSSDTWNNIGAVLSQTKDYQKAIDAFTQSLLLNPKHSHARSNRAAIYLQQRHLKEAIWEYTLYLRTVPDDAEAYYNMGVAWMLSGRLEEAKESFIHAIKINADHIDSWCNLGAIYVKTSCVEEAYDAYSKVLKIEENHQTAQFMMSALQQSKRHHACVQATPMKIPEYAPLSYIKALFDNYADSFEKHLLTVLDYQVPQQLYRWMQPYLKEKSFNTVDLGCGTGLAGQVFRSVAHTLTGVDISEEMLEKAKEKRIYDVCIAQDIISFFQHSDQCYDLLLSADTLVYFGDLSQVLQGASRITSVGGYFGFSVELLEMSDMQDLYYTLKSTGRYQHRLSGIKQVAQQHGWQWIDSCAIKGRTHQMQSVISGLCLLQKVPS